MCVLLPSVLGGPGVEKGEEVLSVRRRLEERCVLWERSTEDVCFETGWCRAVRWRFAWPERRSLPVVGLLVGSRKASRNVGCNFGRELEDYELWCLSKQHA